VTTAPDDEPSIHSSGTGTPAIPLPAEFDWVELRPDEASRYVDLLMLKEDLDFSVALLEEPLQAFTVEPGAGSEGHYDVQKARWNAALVAYARAFATGIRQPLEAGIFSSLEQRARDDHEYFIGLRDRHVAHSVTEFEHGTVLAGLTRDLDARFASLGHSLTVEDNPGPGITSRLLRLAQFARQHVVRRRDAELERLMAYCRTNTADLARRPRVTAVAGFTPSPGVPRARRQTRSSGT
jgi:hypothetical protein